MATRKNTQLNNWFLVTELSRKNSSSYFLIQAPFTKLQFCMSRQTHVIAKKKTVQIQKFSITCRVIDLKRAESLLIYKTKTCTHNAQIFSVPLDVLG